MIRLGSDERYESKIMSGDQPFTAMRFPFWNIRPEREFHYQTEHQGSAKSERRENPSNKLGISILNSFTFPFFAVCHQVQYNPNVHFPRWVAGGHIGLSWVHLVIREGNTPPLLPLLPLPSSLCPQFPHLLPTVLWQTWQVFSICNVCHIGSLWAILTCNKWPSMCLWQLTRNNKARIESI